MRVNEAGRMYNQAPCGAGPNFAMNTSLFHRVSDHEWRIEPTGKMRVPGVIFATRQLIEGMDQKVFEQVSNVAALPGIVEASYAMPDAHWGYGFPIGGVAGFDPHRGGVISAGGVGFDISCGVRNLHTGLQLGDLEPIKERLADALFAKIPAGVGSTGDVHLNAEETDAMLRGGARWAVEQGFGAQDDLERIEDRGVAEGADPDAVSPRAKARIADQIGTLGSGNHYLEVQHVAEVFRPELAGAYGLRRGDIIVSLHCGSRGLGHQIGTEFLKKMVVAAPGFGIELPERELACAPIESELGREYFGAMRAGTNCALANRQVLTQLAREAFEEVAPGTRLDLLYDVSHNTCKMEEYERGGASHPLYVHRKGATRAFGPGHPRMCGLFGEAGQPVLIGGSMGTASYILAGTDAGLGVALGSACHGAGRAMSRHQALRRWKGRQVVDELAARGILIRSRSKRGVAEEAPGAYKDVSVVCDATEAAGLALKVARLTPLICVKG